MAKDSKFLLHFNKLATFQAELDKGDSGVIDTNYHVVFIKDAGMLWARGKYYADSTKSDALNEVYDQATIKTADITATQITVTFTGKRWNSTTRTWDAITETIVLPAATNTKAGLQTALHRTKENAQVLSDYSLTSVSQSNDTVTINSTRTLAPTSANGATSTANNNITIPVATEANAGVLTPLDKTKINDINLVNYDAQDPTYNASNIILNNLKTKVATTKGGSTTTEEDDVTINAATTSTAGVMTSTQVTNLNTVKSYYDFVTGFSTVTSITSIPITYRNVVATISSGATIGIASIPAQGRELHVIIKNSGSANITVNLPNSGNYICTNEDKFIEIYPGLYGEVHILSDGSKVYVRGVGQ